MDKELKPCPFCGGEAKLVTRRQEGTSIEPKHFIMCERCRCMTSESWILKVVVDKWNARTSEVMRCRDCEQFERCDNLCILNGVLTCSDDFCRYGKRREENVKMGE